MAKPRKHGESIEDLKGLKGLSLNEVEKIQGTAREETADVFDDNNIRREEWLQYKHFSDLNLSQNDIKKIIELQKKYKKNLTRFSYNENNDKLSPIKEKIRKEIEKINQQGLITYSVKDIRGHINESGERIFWTKYAPDSNIKTDMNIKELFSFLKMIKIYNNGNYDVRYNFKSEDIEKLSELYNELLRSSVDDTSKGIFNVDNIPGVDNISVANIGHEEYENPKEKVLINEEYIKFDYNGKTEHLEVRRTGDIPSKFRPLEKMILLGSKIFNRNSHGYVMLEYNPKNNILWVNVVENEDTDEGDNNTYVESETNNY